MTRTRRATYGDALVVCGPPQHPPGIDDEILNPQVIVEVLSDSTEADDRGEKWAHDQRVQSLAEYVLVSQREQRIELYTRAGAVWSYAAYGAGETARLESLGVVLSVDSIYADPARAG